MIEHGQPFPPIEGFYRFHFRLDEKGSCADIHCHDAAGSMLLTYIDGARRDLTTSTLGAVLRHPLMTLMVVGRIHCQATRLLLKMPAPSAGPCHQRKI